MVRPKILKESNFKEISDALVEFYSCRPQEYGILERPQKVYEKYAEFISNIVKNKNSRILDLGSGSWRIPVEIGKFGFSEVVGLDYFSDKEFESYQKEITLPNVKLARYIASGVIPFNNETFDAISSLCVLEHIVYVEDFLNEIDRVLKPGGYVIIHCPNWSGINHFITAFFHIIFKRDRFWQLYTLTDCLSGIFRSIFWYLKNLFSKKPKFILIYPRMKNGKIDFERSDDDAVHLCQPLSIKKFFRQKGYKTIIYNRGYGTTKYTLIFNRIFPSLATTNVLVFQKGVK
ncbi:MAG: class I SAM-dependent methyltransferase [Ignavibacteria bacterium]|nr:class I SAM-dependent methyltransferase [Ignavibacteria bacterium]